MTTFTEWLNERLENIGWSYNELARRAGLSSGGVSLVMTEARRPGPEFALGVARALRIPPERVFRKAGILPPRIIGGEDKERKSELPDLYEALGDRDRNTALAVIRTLYEQRGPYVAELRPNDE